VNIAEEKLLPISPRLVQALHSKVRMVIILPWLISPCIAHPLWGTADAGFMVLFVEKMRIVQKEVFSDIALVIMFVCIDHPQRGTADAEFMVPFVEKPELTNVLPLKPGAGPNIATHALPTAWNFCLPGPFILILL